VRIEKLQSTYDITVEYINFPLHPDTPAEGIELSRLFGSADSARREASRRRLRELAEAEGLPMTERTMTYNSRLAQELGAWATEQGKGPEFHRAVFHAYFAKARNISEPDVLVALASSIGLDAATARRVLEERLYKEQINREWSSSVAAGINAVPTYEAGGRQVVGAQSYEVLARLVEAAGATRR